MNRKVERPLSTRAKIIAAAAGLASAWAVISISTAAYHGSAPSDFAAADFSSKSLFAATTAGAQRLSDGNPTDAEMFARQALQMSPISSAALRIFGLSEQSLNRRASAAAIFSQASALGWRDLPTQLWLTQALLASGDREGAAERLDAALRLTPYSRDLDAILDQIVLSDAMTPQIASRMARRPLWRSFYLTDSKRWSTAARLRVIRELASIRAYPTRQEMFALVNAMVRDGQIANAHAIWSDVQGRNPGPLYDPGFRDVQSTTAVPFEWSLIPLVGSNVQPSDQQASPGLVASTDGSAAGVLARQMITLSPGKHSLAVQGSASSGSNKVLAWTIRCGSGQQPLVEQNDLSGAPADFLVPASCPFQYVELRVKSAPQLNTITATYHQLALL